MAVSHTLNLSPSLGHTRRCTSSSVMMRSMASTGFKRGTQKRRVRMMTWWGLGGLVGAPAPPDWPRVAAEEVEVEWEVEEEEEAAVVDAAAPPTLGTGKG